MEVFLFMVERKNLVKTALKYGCQCDLLYGYTCGIHEELREQYPDVYFDAYIEFMRGE